MTDRQPRHLALQTHDLDFAFQIPGSLRYGITQDGRVRRLDTGRWLKATIAKRGGYQQVALWEGGHGRICYVHQLVTLTFHGPRPTAKHDTAHADGNKLNNHFTNLRWATRSENERDKIRHGRSNRGERNGGARLTDAQAHEIVARAKTLPRSSGGKRVRKGGLRKLGREFGVTPSAIWQIIAGRRRSSDDCSCPKI